MTTYSLADRRSQLATAIDAAGIRVDDVVGSKAVPYAVIFGQGMTLAGTPGGQARATFRVALFAGKADAAAAVAELGELAMRALSALWGLAGFTVGDVTPDVIRRTSAGDYLSADVVASALFVPSVPVEEP